MEEELLGSMSLTPGSSFLGPARPRASSIPTGEAEPVRVNRAAAVTGATSWSLPSLRSVFTGIISSHYTVMGIAHRGVNKQEEPPGWSSHVDNFPLMHSLGICGLFTWPLSFSLANTFLHRQGGGDPGEL